MLYRENPIEKGFPFFVFVNYFKVIFLSIIKHGAWWGEVWRWGPQTAEAVIDICWVFPGEEWRWGWEICCHGREFRFPEAIFHFDLVLRFIFGFKLGTCYWVLKVKWVLFTSAFSVASSLTDQVWLLET